MIAGMPTQHTPAAADANRTRFVAGLATLRPAWLQKPFDIEGDVLPADVAGEWLRSDAS